MIKVVDINSVKFIHFNTGNKYAKKFKGIEKEGEKTCSKCIKSKLLKEFFNVGKYSKYSWCKLCSKKITSAYRYKENKRIKLICMIGYGGKCICCGESNIELLTIEHIRNKGHKLIYEHDTTVLMKKLIELRFPEGYTILCWNCNMSSRYMPCIHSEEYLEYYNKNIRPYYYNKQEELNELEYKWDIINK